MVPALSAIALTLARLFAFAGLLLTDAFAGLAMVDTPALASNLIYFSFVTLTSTGYGDIVPVHPIARSLCNVRDHHRPALSGDLAGARLVTLELAHRR